MTIHGPIVLVAEANVEDTHDMAKGKIHIRKTVQFEYLAGVVRDSGSLSAVEILMNNHGRRSHMTMTRITALKPSPRFACCVCQHGAKIKGRSGTFLTCGMRATTKSMDHLLAKCHFVYSLCQQMRDD